MTQGKGYMPPPEGILQAFIFDLDGTLLDSRRPMVRALTETLEEHRKVAPPPDDLVHLIGTPTQEILATVGGLSGGDLERAVQLARELYLRYQLEKVELFVGAREGIRRLAGMPLAVVTIRPRSAAEVVLEAAGLLDPFQSIIGWGDVSNHKPFPDPIVKALHDLGDPVSAATVGDRWVDIAAGRAAGTYTVGVSYGYAHPGELEAAGPDVIVDDLRMLPLRASPAKQ